MARFKKGNVILASLWPQADAIDYVIDEKMDEIYLSEIGWFKKGEKVPVINPGWAKKYTHKASHMDLRASCYKEIGDTLQEGKCRLIKMTFVRKK